MVGNFAGTSSPSCSYPVRVRRTTAGARSRSPGDGSWSRVRSRRLRFVVLCRSFRLSGGASSQRSSLSHGEVRQMEIRQLASLVNFVPTMRTPRELDYLDN